MTWNNKVIWTEGMFLQPQHFQQHDRHIEQQLRDRLQAGWAYGWGFSAITLDDAALNLGKLAITAGQGLLPDGTAFSLPNNDAAPAAFDVPADVRNELVVLALTLQRPGVIESDAEEAGGSLGTRYKVTEVD